MEPLGSTGDDQANGIGVGGDGGIYVGGYVDGALSFDGETQPLAGTGKDAFVFRLVD